MECVKTCAYDNVAVFWRSSGWDKQVASYSEAWQAIVMFALACLYCFVNLGAWDSIRDWTDLLDKQNWGPFTLYALAVWVVGLGILPLLWYLLTRAGIALSRSARAAGTQFRVTSAALIPLGLACWIAFALATTLSMMTFVLQSLSDPFNWGWDLIGMAGSPWHILWSAGIPWLQTACVLIGAAYAMQALYHSWLDGASQRRRAILGAIPLGSFVWTAAAAGPLLAVAEPGHPRHHARRPAAGPLVPGKPLRPLRGPDVRASLQGRAQRRCPGGPGRNRARQEDRFPLPPARGVSSEGPAPHRQLPDRRSR